MHALKFGMVGAANTALDLAIFSALTFGANVPPLIANVVSYSSGVASSFWMNRWWTFRDRTVRKSSTQLPLFVMGNLVGLAISTAVVALLVRHTGPLPAKIVSIGASFLWNFTFSNRMVFRK
jgi:putative flippase GtrA